MSDQKPKTIRPGRKTAKRGDGADSEDSVRSRSLSASGRTRSRQEESKDSAKSSGMNQTNQDCNVRSVRKILSSSDGEDFADPIGVRLKNRRSRAQKIKKDRILFQFPNMWAYQKSMYFECYINMEFDVF